VDALNSSDYRWSMKLEAVRTLRDQMGFTAAQLAKLANIPVTRLAALEAGAVPFLDEQMAIARALSVEPVALARPAVANDPRSGVRFRSAAARHPLSAMAFAFSRAAPRRGVSVAGFRIASAGLRLTWPRFERSSRSTSRSNRGGKAMRSACRIVRRCPPIPPRCRRFNSCSRTSAFMSP
jgi:transcriptional regulator with XRE-family HTH domain